MPFVLQRPFADAAGACSATAAGEDYAAHLSFAETVTARLAVNAGVACDMLDTWALILSAARNAGFWAAERGLRPEAAGARDEPPEHYLAVCAIYRDEASYMQEWIEFHRLVGVERFYLYDNNSVDDHRRCWRRTSSAARS